jgi:hypothetical protein
VADLEQRFLNLRHARAGFNVSVDGFRAEFLPEIGIYDELGRFFMREPGPFGDAALACSTSSGSDVRRREQSPPAGPDTAYLTRPARRGQ